MVGILALQGDFIKHKNILDKLEVDSMYVKSCSDLNQTDALIIPGGESTTLSYLIDLLSLRVALHDYSENHSIFGTCAGMIMLSTTDLGDKVKTLNIMDFTVSRNSWGSQKDSFEQEVKLQNFNLGVLNAVFIRAPKIIEIGQKIVNVDYYKDNAILVEDKRHIACSFHPEIDDNLTLHQYFLDKCYYE